MSLVISGTISITFGYDSIKGWKWDLTEIEPAGVFGWAPETWKSERDAADTGGPMDQDYSYAEFVYNGSIPYKLIRYLLLPDASETSIDEVSVHLDQPSLTEIEFLNSRLHNPIPPLEGNEVCSATFQFAHDKLFEKLEITQDGQLLISEQRETPIKGKQFFDPNETLFISHERYSLLQFMKPGKTREEIKTLLESKISSDEVSEIGAYVSSEFNDREWRDEIADKSLQMSLSEIYTEEELKADREGYEYACAAKDISQVKECPYSEEEQPELESSWKMGFWGYFYPG